MSYEFFIGLYMASNTHPKTIEKINDTSANDEETNNNVHHFTLFKI